MEKRPDVQKILNQLKDFQLQSVEKVFQRLYGEKDRTDRFLIADEVGLGKTLVARGVIAKSIDFLWNKVDRIDVIYICSNREIASQNINRLNITSKEKFSLASRLTLLPIKISGLKEQKLNFISFTPGTSFDLHSRTGIMRERALIYHILKEGWGLYRTGPVNVFQDWASKTHFRDMIKRFPKDYKIDSELSKKFLLALKERVREEKAQGKPDIRSRFDDLCLRFKVFKKPENVSNRDRRDATRLIGEMRMILAKSCLEALEPDLIILDEFQRFKHLLDGEDEMSHLAQHLFNYKNEEYPAKIILLSATPYKMYTLKQEEASDNHYKDFISTVKFLFNNDKNRIRAFEDRLKIFRSQLFAMTKQSITNLRSIKHEIEEELRKVMIRTEKLAQTPDRNGMIKEKKDVFCKVEISDLERFAFIDRVAQKVETSDMVEYWKSSPYLLNLMDDYELKRKFNRIRGKSQESYSLLKLIKGSQKRMLQWERIQKYKRIEPANAKIRMLIENGLDKGSWQLLWVPPSLPYYKPKGVYADSDIQNYTKSLIFSSWQVVPKAIAMLCSYEAERRMTKGFPGMGINYDEVTKKRRPLLVFREAEGRPAGLANLALFYPCMTLAQKIDPLRIALQIVPKYGPPSYMRLRAWVREKVVRLLDEAVGTSEKHGGRPDKRWYWAALALLDRKFHFERVKNWFKADQNGLRWEDVMEERREGEEKAFFKKHVENFKEFFLTPEKLGPRPRNLVDVLTKFALASPAVTALRSLLRLRENEKAFALPQVYQSAATISAGFRVLFNVPETIALIRSLNDKDPYWERVLDYGVSGNLQAVLDEYVHVLKDSLGFVDHPYEEIVLLIAKAIHQALSIRTITLDYEDISAPPYSRRIQVEKRRIRCRYALRLGEDKSEGDEEVTRASQVRDSFNSPFRPFLLATTSIGQEGLDFHQYCHSIYHWNLPANPVDLEQREGRIHRYKGLVIRKNLAKHFGLKKLKEKRTELDPWRYLFDQEVKLRGSKKDDIWPFWVFETDGGAKIDRHVPCMPMSRDRERFRDLQSTLVLYRIVFGQPRQEDLVEFLKRYLDPEEIQKEIENFRIDLSPR
jgi:hypothetical protein